MQAYSKGPLAGISWTGDQARSLVLLTAPSEINLRVLKDVLSETYHDFLCMIGQLRYYHLIWVCVTRLSLSHSHSRWYRLEVDCLIDILIKNR